MCAFDSFAIASGFDCEFVFARFQTKSSILFAHNLIRIKMITLYLFYIILKKNFLFFIFSIRFSIRLPYTHLQQSNKNRCKIQWKDKNNSSDDIMMFLFIRYLIKNKLSFIIYQINLLAFYHDIMIHLVPKFEIVCYWNKFSYNQVWLINLF